MPAQNGTITINNISSLQNPQIKQWAKLLTAKGRLEQGLFLAEGEHMAGEAVREHAAALLLIDEARLDRYAAFLENDLPVTTMPAHVMSKLCDAKAPQGIVAVCSFDRIPRACPTDLGRTVALNAVQDPGNVGTVLRTMDAARFDTLIVDRKTADPFGPKAMRASMGAVFRIPVMIADDLKGVLQNMPGHDIIAGHLQGENFYTQTFSDKAPCLLIGNEGAGIDDALMPFVTHKVRLPMPGKAESLNAGVAAAIMMYEFVRRSL